MDALHEVFGVFFMDTFKHLFYSSFDLEFYFRFACCPKSELASIHSYSLSYSLLFLGQMPFLWYSFLFLSQERQKMVTSVNLFLRLPADPQHFYLSCSCVTRLIRSWSQLTELFSLLPFITI